MSFKCASKKNEKIGLCKEATHFLQKISYN